MLSILLAALLTQVPYAPTDGTAVCGCKQGSPSACAAVREVDPRLADELERAVAQSKTAPAKAPQQQQAHAPQASEAPKPQAQQGQASRPAAAVTGQEHHAISRPIAEALENHRTLRGLYKPRDPRFVTRAADKATHHGYQDCHRKVDQEIIEWLNRRKTATPEQFEAFLREIYSRPEMLARFPNGL